MLIFVLALALVATAFRPEPKAHHTDGWTRIRRSAPDSLLSGVVFALSRRFTLTESLYDVSLPNSPNYGRHWSLNDVAKACAPSNDTLQQMQSFLKIHNLSCALMAGHRDWMACEPVVVEDLERALPESKFYDYENEHCQTNVVRTAMYSLPAMLIGHVDFVGGIKRLPYIRQTATKSFVKSAFVSPKRSRELWHVGSTQGSRDNGNHQEVAGFSGVFFSPADLKQMWAEFGIPPVKYSVLGINNVTNPGGEGDEDIQIITSINQGTPTRYTSTPDGADGGYVFLAWLLELSREENPPLIHSISYGYNEYVIDDVYMARMDEEFIKLGLVGHTFVFASGDWGVNCHLDKQMPEWPASSPHVLSVGGLVDVGTASPDAWPRSGGGFSNFFPDPDFMLETHNAYFNLNLSQMPSPSLYNRSSRGYPDVAAISENVAIIFRGHEIGAHGTSSAAPAVTALISMLADVIWPKKLGYVTPLFYSNNLTDAFVKTTNGAPNSYKSCQGFPLSPDGSWSPYIGHGGINFEMVASFLKNFK